MTQKLPVKTFMLLQRKRTGLIIFILINLILTVVFLKLGYGLMRSPGRFVCFLFFISSLLSTSFGIVSFVRLARDKFTGFFISSDGLNDISTGHNYGIVMWRDVTKIRVVNDVEHPKRKYIVLKVKNPQEYIDREPTLMKRRSMILKMHYYGSPICFSDRALECTFDELEENVRKYYENYLQRQIDKKTNNGNLPIMIMGN